MRKLEEFLRAVSVLSILFFVFYSVFVLFDPLIHTQRNISLVEVNPWLAKTIDLREGREMYVMVVGVTAYVAFSYLIIRNLRRFSFLGRKSSLLLMIPALAILIRTNSEMVKPPENLLVALAILTLVPLFLFVNSRLGRLGKWEMVGYWVVFGVFVVLSLAPPRAFDYGFFIGPALKFLQGERLGTFYMQYNNLGLVLFAAMMSLGFKLHQMEIALALIFVLWMGLYYIVGRKFIEDRFLAFLFIVALVVLRFFAVMHDPLYIPQVGPFRLDLFVPLLLIVWRFGFASMVTASSFALMYVLDSFFGLLYLGIWGVGVLLMRPSLRGLVPLFLPGAIVLFIHILTFGTILPPASTLHQDLALGFQPIIQTSLFWIVAFVFPLCLFLVLSEQNKKLRHLMVFALAVTAAQLIYFYGRSHEHNLLNISGSMILLLFIGLNQLANRYVTKKLVYVAAGIFITLSAFSFGTVFSGKFERAFDRIQRRVLYDVASVDRDIDKAPDFFTVYPDKEKIVVMSRIDSYVNYRYGLRQIGYFAPFFAHVYRDETATFLAELLAKGYHVVFWEQEMLDLLPYYNESRYPPQRRVIFVGISKGNVLELAVVARTKR